MSEPDPGPLDIDPDAPRIRLLRWAVIALLLAGLGACVAEGANGPPDPTLEKVDTTGDESGLPDFGTVGFRVQLAGGLPSTSERCALEAVTAEQRSRGLMEVTDAGLSGYDGMVFRFDEADTDTTFFMRNTRIPLSIAWFDARGSYLGAADMEPCPDEVAECPTYASPRPFRLALEVPKGNLARLGVGPGAVIELLDGCSPADPAG